jgi:hypothetical protein
MKPVSFPQQNFTYTVPPGQEDKMQPLPCYRDQLQTVSLWELTDEEVEWIVTNRKIWLSQWNEMQPLQAQRPFAEPFPFPAQFAFCMVRYTSATSLRSIRVWNSENIEIPNVVEYMGETMFFDENSKPQFLPNNNLNIDDLYFRTPTPEEAGNRAKMGIESYDKSELYNTHTFEESKEMRELIRKNALSMPVLCRKLQAGRDEVLF